MTVPRPMPLLRCRALLAAQYVRVWTIQSAVDVRRARTTGRFTGGIGECAWPADDLVRQRAYAWIRARMAEWIQGFSGEWPVWVWAKRPLWRRPSRGHVLLFAAVPARRVLWSDYDLWHVLLNGGPIVSDEAGWDAWEKASACLDAAEASWEVCLDLLRPERARWLSAGGRIQGYCDGLAWDEVRHVACAGEGLLDECYDREGADGA